MVFCMHFSGFISTRNMNPKEQIALMGDIICFLIK